MNKSFWNTLLRVGLPIYILLIGILIYTGLTELGNMKSKDDIIRETQIQENETLIKTAFDQIMGDLNYIAEMPEITGFYSDPWRNSKELGSRLNSFAENKNQYMQIRLIDSVGWEKVRINSSRRKTEICEPSELQLKSNRYYFTEMERLKEGCIYVSPLDLNIEHGEIETPIVPVLRLGKKIHDKQTGHNIYLILNYLGNTILDQMVPTKNDLPQALLINSDGYYLKGPSPQQEWGFMYSDTTRGLFSRQYSTEWIEMQQNKELGEIKNKRGYFSYSKIKLCNYFSANSQQNIAAQSNSSCEEWILVSYTDKNSIREYIYLPIFKKYLVLAIVGAVLLLFFNVLFVKLRTSQTSERTRTKKHFSFMQSLIETIPNPIFFIDYQNDEFGCNDAFVTLMGKPKSDLKKLGIEKLFHGNEKDKNNEKHAKGDVKVSELKLKYTDGSIHNLHYNKAHIFVDREKIGFVGVYTDVTNIRKAEQALRASELSLKAANRTKNRFFSLIAHDLKNPFHSIMGLSHLLSSNYESLPEADKLHLTKSIYLSSEKTYLLLVNLLDWARLQEGKIITKPVNINIANLVKDNFTLHHTAIDNKKIKTSVDVNPELQAYADENMIRTVFRNLLSNAIKFTEDEEEIHVHAIKKDKHLEVCIRDTGIGISVNELKNLFDIDKSGSANSNFGNKGTGFGLVLCKDFIELNKGKIWVESEEGKGSMFCFSLPVAD